MEGSLVAYKVFTNGSVLNASEINDNLMNQSVMVFSNSTARAAALTAPVEGMLTWLQDTNKYENYNGTAWVALGSSAVLQVLSTAKLDTFTSTSTSYTAITGLTRSITPSSATSKVLVMVQLAFSNGGLGSGINYGSFRLTGGNAATYIGSSAGSRRAAVFGGTSEVNNASGMHSASLVYLDSPATTSAITYGVEAITRASGFIAINRSNADGNDDYNTRGASSITVMEVSA
jgi:hypothetical protein